MPSLSSALLRRRDRATSQGARGRASLLTLALVAGALVAPPWTADAAPDDAGSPVAVAAEQAGTSSGREFWLAFPSSYIESGRRPTLELFLAAAEDGTGSVTVPGIGFAETFTVTAGEVTTVEVPFEALLTDTDGVADRGVRVVADTDVSVYALNQAPFITDAYLGLPVDVLGTEYVVLTWPTGNFLAGTELAVLATEDDTTVTITPSETVGGRQADEPFEVTLQAGEAYQLITRTVEADLTGSVITSDRPVAAFGANECALTPLGVSFCDHIVQQLLPTAAWGSSFVTVPFVDRAGDTVRVIAATDGTEVTIDGSLVATLDRGAFHETILEEPAHLTSSEPVMVSQYMHGGTYDRDFFDPERFGDPSVVPIAPAEQFLAEYTVTTPATGFDDHSINLVVPVASVGAVTIDGVPVPEDAYTLVGDSGFAGAQVSVPAGSKVLAGPMPFGATMYGTNTDDSYAYPGGLSLSPVGLVSSLTIDLDVDGATSEIGQERCATAVVRDEAEAPLQGVRVDLWVTGAHPDARFARTAADGQASFCYTGTVVGEDTVSVAVGPRSASTTLRWTLPVLPPDPDGLVQSFWIYGPLWTIAPDGTEEDLLDDLIIALGEDLGEVVRLFDDVEFREAPALAPRLVDELGVERDDVDVRAGVLRRPGDPRGSAIMVLATPRAGRGVPGPTGRNAIRPGDTVNLNLGALEDRVAPGDILGSDPTYGETEPAPGAAPPTEDVDPVATLAERFTEDPETGTIGATILGVASPSGAPTMGAIPGTIGSVGTDPRSGGPEARLPAIDRMLAHFQDASVGQEVGMSALWSVRTVPTPLGLANTVLGLLQVGFLLYDATEEASSYLDHMLGGGIADDFVPRGSASRGDPHQRTFDEARYSFMTVGEFVGTRTEGLEVQLRTTPVGGSSDVSLNAAVAVRVGENVVIVHAEATELTIDGEVHTYEDLATPLELATATVVRELGVVRIVTDDGHVVRLRCGVACAFVDVFVTPATFGAGSWEGLMGTNQGDPANDLRLRDGTVLERPVAFDTLHGAFADAWRVTAEESLFAYGPDEDPETFTDRSFPSAEVTLASLSVEARAGAEAVCRAGGLGDHDPTTLDECILDVGLTGDPCFARSAQWMGVDFSAVGTGDGSGWIVEDPDDPDDPGDPGDPDDPDDPGDTDDPDGLVCSDTTFPDVAGDHPHAAGICRMVTRGVALGYLDGTYRPELDVSRGQVASFVARALEAAGFELPASVHQGFTDTRGSVHAAAIDQLAIVDVLRGLGDRREFRPDAPVTRDQLAAILVRAVAWARAEPLAPPVGAPAFGDIAGSVHAQDIEVARELGLTRGTAPGRFSPRLPTSRGQSATFLARFLDVIEAPVAGG